MKLMCYLICFVMSLLMVGCGGDEDEPVTEDKPDTSPLPVANFIKSEPPNGSAIWFTDDLTTPIEIRLFFDHPPTFAAVGGVPAQIHGDLVIWEVSAAECLDLLEQNDRDLSVTWKDPDGSKRETILTFETKYAGNPPEIIASTLRDGDQDVDPHFLNLGGIIFVFDEEVTGHIAIQPEKWETVRLVRRMEYWEGAWYYCDNQAQKGRRTPARRHLCYPNRCPGWRREWTACHNYI